MSEVGDMYNQVKAERDALKPPRYDLAFEQFPQVQEIAHKAGFRLTMHGRGHYSICHREKGWLINIYPGNQRLYADKKRAHAPFIQPERDNNGDWTLLTVVAAAIKAQQGDTDAEP